MDTGVFCKTGELALKNYEPHLNINAQEFLGIYI